MTDIAIRVDHLSKRYRIGAARERHDTLRDALAAGLRRNDHGGETNTIWALQDVSFEVKRGEVVGVIGRNGAGKSTLLKILSHITEPTAGRAEIHGRVGSLLEVGTGFHPELTGRENIYLNGAILGMKRTEIAARFDEIVAFAEVERFLDTPVKRYSSGMYVRLAFAVAAHLEPEILLVDEVLAVGDVAFQQRCLGKMGRAAREGRTVVFVSHNMGAVRQLCADAALLDAGRVTLRGSPDAVIRAYLGQVGHEGRAAAFEPDPAKDAQILALRAEGAAGETAAAYPHTHPIRVLVDYAVQRWPVGSYVCIDVYNDTGVRLLWASDTARPEEMLRERAPGLYRAQVTIPALTLAPGAYQVTAAIYAPGHDRLTDARERAISFLVEDGGSFLSNLGIKPHSATMVPLPWTTERMDAPEGGVCLPSA